MTTLEAIKGLTNYPIPGRTLDVFALRRGIDLTSEATQDVVNSTGYKLLEADVWNWLVTAPTISEGGVSFSFSLSERDGFRSKSAEAMAEATQAKTRYGYKGDRL